MAFPVFPFSAPVCSHWTTKWRGKFSTFRVALRKTTRLHGWIDEWMDSVAFAFRKSRTKCFRFPFLKLFSLLRTSALFHYSTSCVVVAVAVVASLCWVRCLRLVLLFSPLAKVETERRRRRMTRFHLLSNACQRRPTDQSGQAIFF